MDVAVSSLRFFANSAEFRQWLEANAAAEIELLVGFYKIGSGRPSMSWPESVDEALCFGWIDGVRRRIDAAAYQIRFTPRKPTSIWSAVNIAKMDALRASGRMTAAGEAAFSRRTEAKSNVYAYEQASVAELSLGDERAFKQKPEAWQFFQAAPASYRKVILHWLSSAKKPETRAHRFKTLVQACADGRRLR